jgi:ribosomal protein S12 methylthiotransferase
VDSESILGRLSQKGYPITDLNQADIGIVNTCSFIEDARKESIDAILDLADLKKRGQLKKIIVCGCLSQRYKDALRKELPEVDAFVGKISLNHRPERFAITPRHYAYLKICEGCLHSCSYCAIPGIKGKFASLDSACVLDKIKDFNRDRISELNIIGQDITGYGLDLYGARSLPKLLKKIINEAGHIGWIRLLYLYPGPGIDELIPVIKDYPKICKYIDMPIQHINDRILKAMQRGVAKKDILRLIEKIRKNIPDAAIRTSLIVGFPSETEREFQELLDFVKDTGFERLGAFIYSREQGTPACNFKKQIPKAVKIERLDAIMSAQKVISREVNKKFLGKTVEVLIDERQKDYYMARTQHDAPEVDGSVYVNSKRELNPGDFVEIRVTDTMEYDLVGEVSDEHC